MIDICRLYIVRHSVRKYFSYGDVISAGGGLQNLDPSLGRRAFEQGIIFYRVTPAMTLDLDF